MKIGLHTFTPYERLFFSRIYPNNHYKLTPPPVMTVVTLYQHQHDKHHLHHSGIIASEKWGGSEFIPTDNSNLNQLYENWFVYFYSRRATLFSQGYILMINHHRRQLQHQHHKLTPPPVVTVVTNIIIKITSTIFIIVVS